MQNTLLFREPRIVNALKIKAGTVDKYRKRRLFPRSFCACIVDNILLLWRKVQAFTLSQFHNISKARLYNSERSSLKKPVGVFPSSFPHPNLEWHVQFPSTIIDTDTIIWPPVGLQPTPTIQHTTNYCFLQLLFTCQDFKSFQSLLTCCAYIKAFIMFIGNPCWWNSGDNQTEPDYFVTSLISLELKFKRNAVSYTVFVIEFKLEEITRSFSRSVSLIIGTYLENSKYNRWPAFWH